MRAEKLSGSFDGVPAARVRSQCFAEGWNAAHDGLPIEKNPYSPIALRQRQWWINGFNARKENGLAMKLPVQKAVTR